MPQSTTSAYNRARYLRSREQVIARTRAREIENPWGVLKSRASAWSKNPTRKNVYRLVHAALTAGFLVRPSSCSDCGKPDSRCKDGRSALHAHHPEPSRPLMVEWLCVKCHAAHDSQKWQPVACPDCGKEIKGVSALKTHRKWIHAA